MSNLKTPRPTPRFFQEAQTFSTKKARGTPRDSLPPRPPVKSCPPISRIFHQKPVQRAQAVSFRSSNSSVLSPHYNQASKELYFDQCFHIESKLGAGSFGEVFKVKSSEDGHHYAVKRSRERFRGDSDRIRKLEEVAKHEKLPKHPNCVRFVKAWEERQHLYIQTELCKTSLENYSETNHDIPETLIWNYTVDLLMAVKHLHDHDLVHMDIKPDNIFISKDGVCKLGDFGLVLDLSKGDDLSDATEGDPKYLAPELMDGKFGKPADVFSLGITLLELASDLDLPRGGEGWHKLREGEIPEEFLQGRTPRLVYIIKWMMDPDPVTRPTAQQILSHPYVKSVWNKRKRQHFFRQLHTQVQFLVQKLFLMLLSLWMLITYPVRKLMPVTPNTPHKVVIQKHPKEWDHSFSDDEIFDDDHLNISDNSMGAAPLDTSTSSTEWDTSVSMNGSFKVPSVPIQKNITPGPMTRSRNQRNHTPRTRSPVMNLFKSFSSTKYTPEQTSSPNLSFRSEHSTPRPPSTTFPTVQEEDAVNKLTIGPKNLMQVFDAESSDED